MVLAQGKCELRETTNLEDNMCQERETISYSKKIQDDDILILGAGAIQPRKGIDIFVGIANELQKIQKNGEIL